MNASDIAMFEEAKRFCDSLPENNVSRMYQEYNRMTREELNEAVYEKMTVAQEQYREWLLSQPPEGILNHCYEYSVREDILFAANVFLVEECNLTSEQCKALLITEDPLSDMFKDISRWDASEYNYCLCDAVTIRANAAVDRGKDHREPSCVFY